MGIFDKILGTDDGRGTAVTSQTPGSELSPRRSAGESPDQQAVERYRYLLRTAPPDAIEQAHEEAFGRLTPEQRRLALEQLSAQVPEYERASTTRSDDPRNLAKLATRAEMRQPGTLERVFGTAGGGAGMGMGGLLAGSFLSSVAGAVVGSMVAQQFLGSGGFGDGLAGNDTADASETASDNGDASGEAGLDDGGGDFGGDFGGGDFDI